MSVYSTINEAYSIANIASKRRFMDNAIPLSIRHPNLEDHVMLGNVNLDGIGYNYTHLHSLHNPIACGSNMDSPHGELCNLSTGMTVTNRQFCDDDKECDSGFSCRSSQPGLPKVCSLEVCQQDSDSSSGICNNSDLIRGFSLPGRSEPIKCNTHKECGDNRYCSKNGFCSKDMRQQLVIHANRGDKFRGFY